MKLMMVIISFVFIAVYVITMIAKEGIPSSVSATYYSLKNRYWFGVTMVSSSMLLLPAMLEMTEDAYRFMAFLLCIGVIACGVAPNFRDGIEEKIHMTGAMMALIFSQLWVGFTNPWFLLIWVSLVIYLLWYKLRYDVTSPSLVFWAEVCGFIEVYSTILSLQ